MLRDPSQTPLAFWRFASVENVCRGLSAPRNWWCVSTTILGAAELKSEAVRVS